ncbi:MAG: 7-carboxy-7-deazaguanine synthase [Lentisphaerae bacterium ADurb.Bin242]|nr:MAG: 7-carboxy-7-deazaguanine synthase [Lentisphaerae bacterium ADurb.Bin242]
MNGPSLYIYETFSSIQGESTHAGLPCFFIRLAECNLRCSYCDTKRAQTREHAVRATPDELAQRAAASGLNLVEITGGEPMLQKDGVIQLSERLLADRRRVLIETNGSCDLSVLPPGVMRIIDFKTPSSGEHARMFEPNFSALRPSDEVKFVLSDERDYRFALDTIARFRLNLQTENILFSPVFGRLKADELAAWMLRDKPKARLNLQLHKYIWDPSREGV